MIPAFDSLTIWLAETFVQGTVVLAVAVAALAWIRQPARRMPVAWGTMAGLVALALLPALSWWPRIELPVWHNAGVSQVPAQSRPIGPVAADSIELSETNEPLSAQADVAIGPLVTDGTTNFEHAQSHETELVATNSLTNVVQNSRHDPRDVELGSSDTSSVALNPDFPIAATDSHSPFLSWPAATTGLWLMGAVLTTIWIAGGAWGTHRLFRQSRQAPDWIREELRQIMPSRRREPATRVSRLITSALAYGAIRPAILLREPRSLFQEIEPNERCGVRAALAHEYAHIAHGDLWLLALERMLLPVYFAHPLFWVLRRWVRRDQELLADAAAAGESPVEYAQALLEWAKSAPLAKPTRYAAALPLWNSPCHLKRRIEMLLDARNPIARQASRLWHGTVLATILGIIIGVSLVTLRPVVGCAQAVGEQPVAERPQAAALAAPEAGVSDRFTGSDSVGSRRPDRVPPKDMETADDETDPRMRKDFRVWVQISMLQVDHAKLAQLGTSLSNFAAEKCVFINESRTKENVIGVHTSWECSRKLIEALKAHGVAKSQSEQTIQSTIAIRPKVDVSPTRAQSDDGTDVKHDFKNVQLTLRLATMLAHPANGGVLYVKLDVSGERNPKIVESNNGVGSLKISTSRKIGYASYVKVGQSLLIVDDSTDSNSDPQADRVSLIIVSPTKLERMPDSEPESGRAHDVDSPRRIVEELKDEIRMLQKPPPRGAANVRPQGSQDTGGNIQHELLLLDVREAKLIVGAAKAAFDFGTALHAQGSLSDSELAARKLDFQKAEIAKKRSELRLKKFQIPAVDLKAGSSQLDHDLELLQKQKQNVESLELQLKAAMSQANQPLNTLPGRVQTPTAASPAGVTEWGQFSMPLGLRQAQAKIRNTELRLLKAREVLFNMERELRRELAENPTQTDSQGDVKRQVDTEERHVVLRARFIELPQASLEQIRAQYVAAANPNTFFAEIASGKEASLTGILDSGDVTVLDKLIAADREVKTSGDSRLTALSGQPVKFVSMREVAIPAAPDKDGNASAPTVFRGTGISLLVVATVQDRDLVRLQIIADVSAFDTANTVDGIPGVNTRRVQTTVELRAGQAVALSGLRSISDPATSVDRIPIPIVTNDLSARRALTQKPAVARDSRFLILVTPEIVRLADTGGISNPKDRGAAGQLSEPPSAELKPEPPKADASAGNSSSDSEPTAESKLSDNSDLDLDETGAQPAKRQVAATVNGQPIFVDNILRQLPSDAADVLSKAERELLPGDFQAVRQLIIKMHLESHIENELLRQSLKSKIKADQLRSIESQIDATYNAEYLPFAMQQAGATTEAEFEQVLQKRGSSVEMLRSQYRNKQLAHQYLGARCLPKTGFDQADALKYYQENKENYAIRGQAKWEHIRLLFSENDGLELAKEKAAKIIERLKQGEDFAAIARECSDGPTAKSKGGLRDWTAEGSLANKEVERALREQPVGEIGSPVETEEAIEIVRVIERTPSGYQPLESVQDGIKTHLKMALFQKAAKAFLKELREKATIELEP